MFRYNLSDDSGMSDLERTYHRGNRRKLLYTCVILAAAIALAFASIFLSQLKSVTFELTWDVLVAHFYGTTTGNRIAELVVWEYNVPRAIMGIFVGAGLAIGGAVMQSLMRNPLADPYTTGVASGASFGAALMIMLGISIIPVGSNYNLSVTLNAIILSLVPTIAIVLISKRKSITPTTMILAGVAIMYVFRASTSLMTMLADPEAVEQLYIWNVGSLGPASWDNVWVVVGMTTVCAVLLQLMSRSISIMTSGDRSATSMGIRVKAVRAVALFIVAAMTATMVGFTGTIGFMGLVAPHVARMLVGSNARYLIPCSAAVGALLLIGADCIAKVLIGIPVGVVTAVVGGPIFIVLLIKGAKKVWY
ncbi:MAG: iron ABC transporter permease [Thermoplasmata archaeon]|nr:iron ABC transporter permease [Thermoplasmata archaeon]